MCTVVTAALQWQYLQTELILWIHLILYAYKTFDSEICINNKNFMKYDLRFILVKFVVHDLVRRKCYFIIHAVLAEIVKN
jgi:hypothetical protein